MAKSKSTHETYQKIIRHFLSAHPDLDTNADIIEAASAYLTDSACNSGSNTFYKRKAALAYFATGMKIEARRAGRMQDVAESEEFLAWLKRDVPTYATIRKEYDLPRYKSKTSRTRRKKLPFETIKAIHDNAAPREQALIQLLYCCGARTSEIISGIRIETNDDSIALHITGAKKTATSGNDRIIHIDRKRLTALFGAVHITDHTNHQKSTAPTERCNTPSSRRS